MADRRALRCAAMCLIFESEFVPGNGELAMECFSDEIGKNFGKKDIERACSFLSGVTEHKAELDEIISEHLRDWTIDRISKTDLSILRLALYEIVYLSVPVKVSINEAVELSKVYSDEKSPAFINGVLGGYVNSSESE